MDQPWRTGAATTRSNELPTWSASAAGVAVDSQMAIEEVIIIIIIIIIKAFLLPRSVYSSVMHTV